MQLNNGSPIATIRSLEDARYAAMLAEDVPALDAMLDAELTYSHSNGTVQSKQEYLDAFRLKHRKYHRIERTDQSIIVRGDLALVYCNLDIQAVVKNAPHQARTFALAVWARSGQSWRLLALHSTARSPKQ